MLWFATYSTGGEKKTGQEWKACSGRKWNNPRACRYRPGSFSTLPVILPQTTTLHYEVSYFVVQTSCPQSLGLKQKGTGKTWKSTFKHTLARGPFTDRSKITIQKNDTSYQTNVTHFSPWLTQQVVILLILSSSLKYDAWQCDASQPTTLTPPKAKFSENNITNH